MHVSEARLAANLQNAARSTGPRDTQCSRLNATKHGLAGDPMLVEAALPEFAERRALWVPVYQPSGEAAEWALDQAVAASLRIERCGRALESLATIEQKRASLAWEQDRGVEAATIFGRLAKDPALASRQLEATFEGVRMLIDAWFDLARAFEAGEDWTEAEASLALDLLGVAPDRRSRRTPIDPPLGVSSVEFRQALVLKQLDRLEPLRDEVMGPIDELEREAAMEGDVALVSKQATLILRYEAAAWRRYREAIKLLRERAEATAAPVIARPPTVPSPVVAIPPAPGRNEATSAPSFEQERRSLLDQAAKILAGHPNFPVEFDLEDDAEWLDAPATEQSHSRRRPVGPSKTA